MLYFKSKHSPNASRNVVGYRVCYRMGNRMGYMRDIMGYRLACEVAFPRVCLGEAALGSRAGLRAGSGFGPGRTGRVGVGPGSGPAGSGRTKHRSG